MKDVVEAVKQELTFLGSDPEVRMIHPDKFKGGFVLHFPGDLEVTYLDWEFRVTRGEKELFGAEAHPTFSGNVFSPEHLCQYIDRIARIVREQAGP